MTSLPTWGDFALLIGGVGGAVAWIDNRIGTGKKNRKLEAKLETAEEEVRKAQQAASSAINAKNNELRLLREARDEWKSKAMYWQDHAQHLETLASQKGGQ